MLKKEVEPVKKSNKTLVITIIIISLLLAITIAIGYFTYNYFKNREITRYLETGPNIEEALVKNESFVYLKLNSSLNLNRIINITFSFSDTEENYYNHLASFINESYELNSSHLGLDDFRSIEKVIALLVYETSPANASTQNQTTNQTASTSGGTTSPGGGGPSPPPTPTPCTDTCLSLGYECGNWTICGSLTDCGNCSGGKICQNAVCVFNCTDDAGCYSEGLFCQVNTPYNCSLGNDSCLDRTNLTDCQTGYRCDNGSCVQIPSCTDDSNCTSLNLLEIAACNNIPDNLPLTYDYAPEDLSTCNLTAGKCTSTAQTLTHTCNLTCGAGCLSPTDCSSTECDPLDGCQGLDYYDYNDVANNCAGCVCENNLCNSYTVSVGDLRCVTSFCGDGNIGSGEICDGTNLSGETCQDFGFTGGTLACLSDCSDYDITSCTSLGCGNNNIELGEWCECGIDGICGNSDDSLWGNDCTTVPGGFSGGNLTCLPDCLDFDTTECIPGSCVDNIIGSGELCECGLDGICGNSDDNLLGNNCTSIPGGFTEGNLTCLFNCSDYDTSQCFQGTTITQCRVIDRPNTRYTVERDINQLLDTSCIKIHASGITLDCQGYSITSPSLANIAGVYSNGSNTIIENCNVDGLTNGWGIYLDGGADYSSITNNVLSNNYRGIDLYYSGNSIVSGNTITGHSSRGMYVYASSSCSLTGNIISNNQDGIIASQSSSLILTGNTLNNNVGVGVNAFNSDNSDFTSNTANGNGAAGIQLTGSGNTINNNIANSNGFLGIYIAYSSTNNYIADNTANNNAFAGIQLYQGANSNTLTGNTANYNGQHGLHTSGSLGNTITGNDFCSNTDEDVDCSSDQTFSNNYCDPSGGSSVYVCGGSCTPCGLPSLSFWTRISSFFKNFGQSITEIFK